MGGAGQKCWADSDSIWMLSKMEKSKVYTSQGIMHKQRSDIKSNLRKCVRFIHKNLTAKTILKNQIRTF